MPSTDTPDADTGPAPVLIATAGNIFLTDDGFGPEVARRLAQRPLPDGVEVRDYGIGGLHLAYDLLDGHATLVLIDTISRGGPPGTLSLLEVTEEDVTDGGLQTHGMDPATVLATLRTLGGRMPRTLVLGCEPEDVSEGIGLTATAEEAVEHAIQAVLDLLDGGLVAGDVVPGAPASAGTEPRREG
jgi:hydrogenase maturation protease